MSCVTQDIGAGSPLLVPSGRVAIVSVVAEETNKSDSGEAPAPSETPREVHLSEQRGLLVQQMDFVAVVDASPGGPPASAATPEAQVPVQAAPVDSSPVSSGGDDGGSSAGE
jgi:hypothetical protein